MSWGDIVRANASGDAMRERTRILDMLRAKESSWQAQCDVACSESYRDECRGAMQALRSAIEWIEASK